MRFEFRNGSFDLPPGHCVLFGILNVTPDSFSDGGRYSRLETAVEHGLALEKDGADVVDIGGESTRPGAQPVSAEEEIHRVIPVIRALKSKLKIPVSVDTTKAAVAEAAAAEGAVIINDVSGFADDPRMATVAAASGAGVILMHRRGTPTTMQNLCRYENVVEDVRRELQERLNAALAAGIPRNRIALDPGIGFAKTREQNLELLRNLKVFSAFSRPVMIGVSRKSFLGGELQTRSAGTLAAELWSWLRGARMIRTHDVASTRRALNCLTVIIS